VAVPVSFLPFQLNDFLELVDWTGRILRDDKSSKRNDIALSEDITRQKN